MARKMRRVGGKTVINVKEHIIVRNFWEYYVTDKGYNKDIRTCLVMGDETELGDVSLAEIAPYIRTRTSDLRELMPAVGWEWID